MNTVIFLIAIVGTELTTHLMFGSSVIRFRPTLLPTVAFCSGSIGFYLSNKWCNREIERLADIGAMEHIGAEKLAKGLVEQQIIYGIPLPDSLKAKLYNLRHTHPPTVSRIRFAGQVSDIPVDELVDRIDLEAIQENAEKYAHPTPEVDEKAH